MFVVLCFLPVDQEDKAINTDDNGPDSDSESDDSDEHSTEDNLSDIDNGNDDDDDDDNSAGVADTDNDNADDKAGFSEENSEPPAKKCVRFAESVEIEKPPATQPPIVTVSGLYCICFIILVIIVY